MPSVLASPRAAVAVLAVVTVLGARRYMRRRWADVPAGPRLGVALVRRFALDVRTRRRRLQWAALLGWGALVAALHFSLLANGLYARVPWLDLPSHAMSGAGVAGVLLVGLRRELPSRGSAWWLVLAVLAVGAGFELYEFCFRSFWHHWTLATYARDTVLDLGVDALGAALVASVGTDAAGALERDGVVGPGRRGSEER